MMKEEEEEEETVFIQITKESKMDPGPQVDSSIQKNKFFKKIKNICVYGRRI